MKNDTFISRIDGQVKNRKDFEKLNDSNIKKYMLKVKDILDLNNELNDNNKKYYIKYLYQEWNFPKETIDIIFKYFSYSFDTTYEFLEILDSENGSLEHAWDVFSNKYDIEHQPFPF